MYVVINSQCSKNALKRTRRILDNFAMRMGQRTWQTKITAEGLEHLKLTLRKGARKNTAVACHKIYRNKSKLEWIVGNATKFNEEGHVATRTTSKEVHKSDEGNNWHYFKLSKYATSIACLFHDIGKANSAFQNKLRASIKKSKDGKPNYHADILRHEWLSYLFFEELVFSALVDNSKLTDNSIDLDQVWIEKFEKLSVNDFQSALNNIQASYEPQKTLRVFKDCIECESRFKELPKLAKAIAWLIVTHHRLLNKGEQKSLRFEKFKPSYNFPNIRNLDEKTFLKSLSPNLEFKDLTFLEHNRNKTGVIAKIKRISSSLLRYQSGFNHIFSNRHNLHVSRLCLMLADHTYSSVNTNKPCKSKGIAANTTKGLHNKTILNQTLDEHLLGVENLSRSIFRGVSTLKEDLPYVAQHKYLKKDTKIAKFKWQNKACAKLLELNKKDTIKSSGYFVINMASTGAGKTIANMRLANSMADKHRGLRTTICVGLRTLTLQAGRSLANDVGLDETELKVLIGCSTTKELFNKNQKDNELVDHKEFVIDTNKYSRFLMDDELELAVIENAENSDLTEIIEIDLEDEEEDEPEVDHSLIGVLNSDKFKSIHTKVKDFIEVPILCATIDYMVKATESTRGGKQILPLLRLLSGSLILDEPDDFGLDDLPALSRLIYACGMCGGSIIISSATLSPVLCQGLYNAYILGRQQYIEAYNLKFDQTHCLMIDELTAPKVHSMETSSCLKNLIVDFGEKFKHFAETRCKELMKLPLKQKAFLKFIVNHSEIESKDEKGRLEIYTKNILESAIELHENHSSQYKNIKVSIGLIRFANIKKLIKVYRNFEKLIKKADKNTKFICGVYHSSFPLIVRYEIEKTLDEILTRKKDSDGFLENEYIKNLIDQETSVNSAVENITFLVFASPVTEVGRDHDYDFAIIEPSSVKSIIQTAGRVNRHRADKVSEANIYILNQNYKSYVEAKTNKDYDVFSRPGYQSKNFTNTSSKSQSISLQSTQLAELNFTNITIENLNSSLKLIEQANLHPNESFVNYEHRAIASVSNPDSFNNPLTNFSKYWLDETGLPYGEKALIENFNIEYKEFYRSDLSDYLIEKTRFRKSSEQEFYYFKYDLENQRFYLACIYGHKANDVFINDIYADTHSDPKYCKLFKINDYSKILLSLLELESFNELDPYSEEDKNLVDKVCRKYFSLNLNVFEDMNAKYEFNKVLGIT